MNNPGGQPGHYDTVAAAGNGAQAAESPSDHARADTDRETAPETETEAAISGGSDGGDNIQLRRYVAEVSASAEAVDQLQRSGNLDLQPVVAEAAQEWANDRDEEDNDGEDVAAVEATEEANLEASSSIVSPECNKVLESDTAKLSCVEKSENLQFSQSTSEAQLDSIPTCSIISSPNEESLQESEIFLENMENREVSDQEDLTSSDIQV